MNRWKRLASLGRAGCCGIALVVASGSAGAAGGGAGTGKKPTESTNDYDYYLTGNAANQTPPPNRQSMTVLMGGGEDVDDAFKDMFRHAGCDLSGKDGTPLDVVIVRASGADGYNPYLFDLGQRAGNVSCVDSVETFVVKTRTGAESDAVVNRVSQEDVLFIAGGDQSTYVQLWSGTKLESTLKALAQRNVPFGGTSAGLAVLGAVDYTGENGSVTSADALSNPYDKRVTLSTRFLNDLPNLASTVTDSHLFERDRMGRLVTFLARMGQDSLGATWSTARGIGVTEATALVVSDRKGVVRFKDMPGAPSKQSVYFLNWSSAAGSQAVTVVPKTPLNFQSGYLQVQKLTACNGCVFDLGSWSGARTSYWLQVNQGVLGSSQNGGSAY